MCRLRPAGSGAVQTSDLSGFCPELVGAGLVRKERLCLSICEGDFLSGKRRNGAGAQSARFAWFAQRDITREVDIIGVRFGKVNLKRAWMLP